MKRRIRQRRGEDDGGNGGGRVREGGRWREEKPGVRCCDQTVRTA